MRPKPRNRWPLTTITAATSALVIGALALGPQSRPDPDTTPHSVDEALAPAGSARMTRPDITAETASKLDASRAASDISATPHALDPGSEIDAEAMPRRLVAASDDADSSRRAGSRHRGEEGRMGAPSAKHKAGLYAMKGPREAVPVLSRSFGEPDADDSSPYGGAFAVGADESEGWGGLTGTEVGESYGVGGLGLIGTGRGGGGVGEAELGLGRGPGGGFDPALQARALTVGTVDDFSDQASWALATERLANSANSLGITKEWLERTSTSPRHVAQPNRLDIALVLDTTGSMGDELEYLKVELRDIAEQIRRSHPEVDQRWALVVYRDAGDDYVVKTHDFSELSSMVERLGREHASGGGDFPEAMDWALAASAQLSWRQDPSTARMVLLVADAPPHSGESARRFMTAVDDHARGKTAIYPISASGVNGEAEIAMRIAARATGGQYIYLTDHSGIGGPHKTAEVAKETIETLHDALVRLVDAELGGRSHVAGDMAKPTDPAPRPSSLTPGLGAQHHLAASTTENETIWQRLQRRLAEHFLLASALAMAVLVAFGGDLRRRRACARNPADT